MKHVLLPVLFSFVLVGCAATKHVDSAKRAGIEFRQASIAPFDSAELMTEPGQQPQQTQPPLYVSSHSILTNADFISASITKTHQGQRAVFLKLSDAASDRFFNFTGKHLREPIAILVDGKLIAAPIVMSALRNSVQITSGPDGLTEAEAQRIVSAVGQK